MLPRFWRIRELEVPGRVWKDLVFLLPGWWDLGGKVDFLPFKVFGGCFRKADFGALVRLVLLLFFVRDALVFDLRSLDFDFLRAPDNRLLLPSLEVFVVRTFGIFLLMSLLVE